MVEEMEDAAAGRAPLPETTTTDQPRRLWSIGAAILLVLLAATEALYLGTQRLLAPASVELGGIIYFSESPHFDPINCLFAGQQTGWIGYKDYLGFMMSDQSKLDVVAQDGVLALAAYELRNCQSVTESFSVEGDFAHYLLILNRFGQIWYRVEEMD